MGGDGGRIKEVSESVELAESLDAFCHNALDSVLNGDDAVDKTSALSLKSMLYDGALVHPEADLLDGCDAFGRRNTAGSLDYLDALFFADSDIAVKVRLEGCGQEGDVDCEGLVGEGLDLFDLGSEILCGE